MPKNLVTLLTTLCLNFFVNFELHCRVILKGNVSKELLKIALLSINKYSRLILDSEILSSRSILIHFSVKNTR